MTATTRSPKTRTLLLSVSIRDCRVETFRAGGPGGQNQNKRDTACRIHHDPSGAVGESRTHRTQLENKRAAFRRMAESGKFRVWLAKAGQTEADKRAEQEALQSYIRQTMSPTNIRVEQMTNGRWEEIHDTSGDET